MTAINKNTIAHTGSLSPNENADGFAPLPISERGKFLYDTTYQTMINRIKEYGYAPTSITGAYWGMFPRDSSIQIMAHLANGDEEAAKMLLEYIIAYHVQNGNKYMFHIINDLLESYVHTFDSHEKIYYTAGGIGIFGINAPGSGAAQYFIPQTDVNISNIEFLLTTAAKSGYFEVTVSENDVNGNVIAVVTKNITSAISSPSWVEFNLNKKVILKAGQKYAISVRAWETNGARTVAYGKTSADGFNSYSYDSETDKPYTMSFKLLTDADMSEEGHSVINEQIGVLKNGEQIYVNFGFSENFLTSARFALEYGGTADGILYFDLYKGNSYVMTKSIFASEIKANESFVNVTFGLALEKVTDSGEWNVAIRAEGFGTDGVKLYGNKKNGLAWNATESDITQNSKRIQVDANYMFVNAYAMFSLGCFDRYRDFINKTFETVLGYAYYFIENFSESDGGYNADAGIILNPCLEHGRGYMKCYDPITNCFAAESCHKLAEVAKKLGKHDVSSKLYRYADMISDGINKNLVCSVNGKTIYTEVIDIGNNKFYKGFSFVSLAAAASDWYAVDEEIFENTYEEYRKIGSVDFGGFDITSSYVTLDDNDNVIGMQNYICGKALAWELYYCWKTGRSERARELLDFIDTFSSDGGFDEGYFSDGRLRDTANQEHANWLYFEIARVCGLYKNL